MRAYRGGAARQALFWVEPRGLGCYIPAMSRSSRPSRASRAAARARSAGAWPALLRAPEVARPWPSLVFLSPFLVFYTVGLLWVRPDWAARADLWIRWALAPLGLTGALVPTAVVVIVLVAWHVVRRDPWRFPPRLLAAMAVETALLALPLLGMEGLFQAIASGQPPALAVASGPAGHGWVPAAVASIGAAIYEELLFRLLLVSALVLAARRLAGLKDDGAVIAAVLVAAALFAGAHNIDRAASFTWPRFLFHTAAGVYLSAVFFYRGFGIAAGVHFAYNLIVKLATAGT